MRFHRLIIACLSVATSHCEPNVTTRARVSGKALERPAESLACPILHTLKDEPQPQVDFASGFSILKPLPFRPSR